MLKKIIYGILALQENILRAKLARTIGVKNTSLKKCHYFKGGSIELGTLAESEKQKLEEELNIILKKHNYEPEKILKYIEKHGTKVVFIKDAAKYLNPAGENEGFIYPAAGAKALYLSLAVNKNFSLKTDEMFVLSNGTINKYYFLYHFYNWYAFKHNIAGLDRESQELLKKYLFESVDTKELQLADIYKLKDAIRQDKASIEFVIKLCRNYEGTKQALKKIQQNGSAKL